MGCKKAEKKGSRDLRPNCLSFKNNNKKDPTLCDAYVRMKRYSGVQSKPT